MIGYIILGIFAVILLYIVALYFINSKKIKSKNKDKVEKEKKEDKKSEKVEVTSEISGKTPLEQAVIEASQYSKNTEIEEAYKKMEDQRKVFESHNQKIIRERTFRKDRDHFKTELQMAMETNKMAMENNIISSDTNVIGKEGPSQKQIDETNRAIAKEHEQSHVTDESIANEIRKMSPEAKAVLINDILGKKY